MAALVVFCAQRRGQESSLFLFKGLLSAWLRELSVVPSQRCSKGSVSQCVHLRSSLTAWGHVVVNVPDFDALSPAVHSSPSTRRAP